MTIQEMVRELLGDTAGKDVVEEIARAGLRKRLDNLMYAMGEIAELNEMGRKLLAVEIEARIGEWLVKYADNPYALAQFQLMRDMYEAMEKAWATFDQLREENHGTADQATPEADG